MVAESEVEHCGIIYVHQEKPGDTARSQYYLMIRFFSEFPPPTPSYTTPQAPAASSKKPHILTDTYQTA